MVMFSHWLPAQLSVVQTLPSLQPASVVQQPLTGVFWQLPFTHLSTVQGLLSTQPASEVQQPAMVVF
jgi:hypothetical protein